MPDQQDYEKMLPRLKAIEGGKVRGPDRPVEVAAKEAEMTALWAPADKAKFDAVNFDWTLVKQMPAMAGALRWSEALWSNRRRLQADAHKSLENLLPVASDLRDEVLCALDFAGDEDDALQGRIAQIREGESHGDLVLDCPAVVDLAEGNRELLEGINFDMKTIDELAQVGDRLAAALGGSDVEKLAKSEEKMMRDRAFTLLDNALRKVRKCGRYVCRGEEERLKGYLSEYNRANRLRQMKKEQEKKPMAQEQASV